MQKIGELAAFSTAICWTLSAIIFEMGIKRIGVLAVNFVKVIIAFLLLTLTSAIMRGMPLPFDAAPNTVLYLALSGIIGFTVSDMFLFTAYGTIGPRIATLFLALSPPMTAGIAYLFMGEALGHRGAAGMCLVIVGICVTVIGRNRGLSFLKMKKDDVKGYICAFAASFVQSVSLNLTKYGLGNYDPVSGTQIRIFAALIGFAIVSLFYEKGKTIGRAIKNLEGLKFTAIGSVFGPFLGVVLSLYALQRVSSGIVSTLIGLTPVLIIIPETFIFKKKIRTMEIIGAIIAVAGTAVFFL
ncbi:MAG: DMT family transporter [Treponema sp.]|nr:DMT family transporter [Treponema sp.]